MDARMEMVNHCHCVSVWMSAKGKKSGRRSRECVCVSVCVCVVHMLVWEGEHITTKGLKIVGICPCDILRLKACE